MGFAPTPWRFEPQYTPPYHSLEQCMIDSTKRQFFPPKTRCTERSRMPLRLTSIGACFLLTILSLLTGCGGGGETGSDPAIKVAPGSAAVGASATLDWNAVPNDPTVVAYFVHYGRHSPNQPGSCTYESSLYVGSPSDPNTIVSATITNLAPETHYYFAVSAYNGLESPCSNEVSTDTPAPSA